ncbi:Hypothetical predicted protein [Cloeon dipterum]|uniref:RNA exonuclease 4 n=1 Tax=Cloeon dipterum TaxID=197152 RepID=A0A8S1DEK6_9INSE|nr:Hypothetical predicted protein [Cloeon dipterum]
MAKFKSGKVSEREKREPKQSAKDKKQDPPVKQSLPEQSSTVNYASSEKVKPSQNWLLFKSQLPKSSVKPHFTKRPKLEAKPGATRPTNKVSNNVTEIVAIDCEMVGGGDSGRDNILARVSVVNKYNEVLYDTFVKPREQVTDYRTQYSGVRESDLQNGVEFLEAQKKVASLIDNKTLVGHDVKNDLKVLFLGHPRNKIRDTVKYKPFKQLKSGKPSLKFLAEKILGVKIQTGEHNSVEDAKAAMSLYMMHQKAWERLRKEKKEPRDKPANKGRLRRNWERANKSK